MDDNHVDEINVLMISLTMINDDDDDVVVYLLGLF